MARREALRGAGVPLARSKGNDAGELRPADLNVATGRPGRARKKLNISIALIDPKPLTRRSIGEMLAKALPDYVTLTAASCEELLAPRSRLTGSPHLIIVYIRNAGVTDSFVQEALELVRLRLPEARVIVLSDRDDVQNINEALTCGVRGYIPTSVEAEVAIAALRLIKAGGTYIPAHERRSATGKPDIGVEGDRRGLPVELDLTPRELSVLDLLREGKPNKLIAAGLNMEESTVKVHVRNILKKLRAANRTEAASVANRLLGAHASAAVRLLRPTSAAGSNSESRHAEPVGG
jgi:DNA-binding NarL/FixJ family response regulator